MNCPECRLEMHIVSQHFQRGMLEDGSGGIFSVTDLQCMNPQCPRGRQGVPTAREQTLCAQEEHAAGTLHCCGAPLLYAGPDCYWVPDGVEESTVGDAVEVQCPQCGERQQFLPGKRARALV